MTVGIEAYHCAVGQFASIFVKLLLKKAIRKARKVYDSEVFKGEVCSGTDIAVFFLVACTVNNASLLCAVLCSYDIVWGRLHCKTQYV